MKNLDELWYSEPLVEGCLEAALETAKKEGFLHHALTYDDAQVLRNVSRDFFKLGMARGMEEQTQLQLTEEEAELVRVYRHLNQIRRIKLQAEAIVLLADEAQGD